MRPSELTSGQLSARNLELAVRVLHLDGLVVVENAIPVAELDKLNEKMVQDARYLQSLGAKGPFNYNQGNLQQDAPPIAEFFKPSIFMSKYPRSSAEAKWQKESINATIGHPDPCNLACWDLYVNQTRLPRRSLARY